MILSSAWTLLRALRCARAQQCQMHECVSAHRTCMLVACGIEATHSLPQEPVQVACNLRLLL